MLAKAVHFLNSEADVVEDAFEKAFLECPPAVEGNSGTALVDRTFERAMATPTMDFFKTKAFQNRDEFTGGQEGKFFTAHAWQGLRLVPCRRTLHALREAADRP